MVAVLALAGCSDVGVVEPAADVSVAVEAYGCGGDRIARRGAGTVLDAELVVTAAHPVVGADRIEIRTSDGALRTAILVAVDVVDDLALLEVPGLEGSPLATVTLTAGSAGTFVGHELGEMHPYQVVRRVRLTIADIYGDGSHTRMGYELAADVEPGDSGAGLVVADGLGGIVFARSTTEQGRAWATSASEVGDLSTADDIGRLPCAPD